MRGLTDRVLAANLMNHKANLEGLLNFAAGQVWQNRAMWTVLGTVVVWLALLTLYILRLK
jgi:hypothetical protein